jgi:hypothetical protein
LHGGAKRQKSDGAMHLKSPVRVSEKIKETTGPPPIFQSEVHHAELRVGRSMLRGGLETI